MTENPGLVSTIIPVHNRPELLAEAVESAMGQEYPHIEVLIVDDASTDHTLQVATGLSKRWRGQVRVLQQEHCCGPGASRQRALEQAQGEFIQYLDSDDLLLPGKFQVQVAALQASPDAQICYGRSYEENHCHQPSTYTGPMRSTGEVLPTLFPHLLQERWWSTSTPLYRHSLCRRIGPWLNLINEEDWEYDARAGAYGAKILAVPHDVSVRRIGLSTDQLSLGADKTHSKLRDKSRARLLIHRHALSAGVDIDSPEMAHFHRAALVLSRQCAAAGLDAEATSLFALVKTNAAKSISNNPSVRLYGRLARWIGWRRAALVAQAITNLAYPLRRSG